MVIKMFISYSSEDIKFVKEIQLLVYTKFRDKIEPVISAQQKAIGVDIPEKIVGHIEECEWFLVLLTYHSISNPTVMHELGYAYGLFKAGKIRILPIVERIKDNAGKYVPIDVGIFFPKSIESAEYIDEEDKWDRCIKII